MQRFEWDPGLETGIAQIDDQHRGLFDLAEKLDEGCKDSVACPEIVQDAIYELTEYCIQHFADEELLMQRLRYPYYEQHRAIHERLTVHMMQTISGKWTGVGLYAIAPLFVELLTNDAQEADMRLAEYLRAYRREHAAD